MPAITKEALALLIIGIIVGAAGGFLAASSMKPAQPAQQAGGKKIVEIPIGALLPLTGPLSSFAKKNEIALQMAIDDVNAFAAKSGSKFRFKLLVEDTQLDKQVALSRLQSLAAQNVKIVIGPMASGVLAGIKNFADSNKIVIISQSSTAPSLAIPGDFVFRLAPTDNFQSKALAKLIETKGFKKVAVIYRGDAWGVGLYEAFEKKFTADGGQVQGVKYDPKAKDLSGEVAKLSSIVKSMGEGTAVLMISFEDDGIQIIKLAAQDPTLSSTQWFGTDGTALSSKIVKQVGSEAIKLGGVLSTIFQPARNPIQANFIERFKAKAGEAPDAYSMNAYDAVWIAALSVMSAGTDDGAVIVKILPTVAEHYFGVSGNTMFDANGDRAGGDYAIWQIVKTANGAEWKLVGSYSALSDSVTFFTKS